MRISAYPLVLRFSLALWIPLLLVEATRPFDSSTLLLSPAIRTAFGYSAAIALTMGFVISLATFAMSGAKDERTRALSGQGGSLVAATCFLATITPIQAWGSGNQLAPHLSSLLCFAVALVAGGLASWIGTVSAPKSGRPVPTMASLCVLMLVWAGFVLATSKPRLDAPQISVFACGIASALWIARDTVFKPPETLRGGVVRDLCVAIIVPCIVMLAFDPRGVRSESPVGVTPPTGTPNVLVVVVDTLRADHTGLADAGRPTTPGLSRWADARGTRFTSAWSAAPNTIPSIKAMFTGRLASQFGGENRIVEPPPLAATTLAETLHAAGFETAAITANGLVSGEGFEQGFSRFRSLASHDQFIHSFFLNRLLAGERVYRGFEWMDRLEIHKERGHVATQLAAKWMFELEAQRAETQRPFFIYLHLLDPHWPYYNRGLGGVPPGLAEIDSPFSHIDFLRLPPPNPAHAEFARDVRMQEMIGRYDDEILAADRAVTAMLDQMAETGLLDSTLVVLVGDHGEEFFEHWAFGHGQDVYIEELHVPLVLLWPDGAKFQSLPAQVPTPVSLVDVLPTLVELLALDEDTDAMLGTSLVPLLSDVSADRPAVIAESRDSRGLRLVWRDGTHTVRLAYSNPGEALTTADVSVFDQQSDPKQQEPLDLARPDVREIVERARRDLVLRQLR